MLNDKAPFVDVDLKRWRNGESPIKRKHKSLMDVVENWKDFRHAEGFLDVDLLLLWCDNV